MRSGGESYGRREGSAGKSGYGIAQGCACAKRFESDVQSMEDKGVAIDPNTLYPLLRRLEKQGLLKSTWETGGSKPRKYYERTAYGDEIYKELKHQWENMACSMEQLLKEG